MKMCETGLTLLTFRAVEVNECAVGIEREPLVALQR